MSESKSTGEWLEWVKSCSEIGQSKAALNRLNALNYHQFLYVSTTFNKKFNSLIPVKLTNANEPLAIIRLGHSSMLEVASREGLNHIISSLM